MAATRAAMQTATESFVEAWRNKSIEGMLANRTPDCLQSLLPSTTFKQPEATNEQFAATMGPAFGTLSNFEVNVKSISYDVEQKRSFVHALTAADSPVMPYRDEHIIIFTFTDDGTKIKRVDDMLDSAFVSVFMPKTMEYLSQQGKN